MTKFAWGGLVWGCWIGLFLVLELVAIFWRGCPWPTLSRTAWDVEDAWRPAQLAFLVFLAALLVHIVARAPLYVIGRGPRP